MAMTSPSVNVSFELLHVDDTLLVVDKPGGLLAVPGRGAGRQDCLAARVQARYPDALIVHRLDMATSGLMVMARGPAAQRALSMAFAARAVKKRYIALVAGRLEAPPEGWGLIDLPLVGDWPNRPRQIVDHTMGKPSLTRWRVVAHDPASGTTRVELEPVTGRSHQLRVHLAALGHPIVGDSLYASPEVQAQAPRLMLHACSLGFAHPETGTRLVFECPAAF